MPGNPKRQLIWIPIIHTQVDLGSLSEAVGRLYIQKIGRGKWKRHHLAVEARWGIIEQLIDQLNLDYKKVRLYQDGLPHCGQEEKIVRELAQAGSRNHQILLRLMAKGAQITGTESPQLLLEEYELARQVLAALDSPLSKRLSAQQKEFSQALLEKRDRFIARRIDESLRAGETGLVFLGMLHSLEGRLPPDIQLMRLEPAHA